METLKLRAENILSKIKESNSYIFQVSETATKLEEDLRQQKVRISGNYLNQTTWIRYILHHLGWIGKDLKTDLDLAEKGVQITLDIIQSLFETHERLRHYEDQLTQVSV